MVFRKVCFLLIKSMNIKRIGISNMEKGEEGEEEDGGGLLWVFVYYLIFVSYDIL